MQIGRRTTRGDQLSRPDIASVFAHGGIPRVIFLEGNLPEVKRAVEGLVTVSHHIPPVLLPLTDRDILLKSRIPTVRPLKEGEWVRCIFGHYRNDIGFICGREPTRDADTIVAFVPRIPEKSSRIGKRKRPARPEPRTWTALQLETVWGPSRVRRVSAEEYEFRQDKYISGLVLQCLPSASLVNIQGSPDDVGPFIRASYIRGLPSFRPWVHRFAQDTIQPGQRVQVESGDQRGSTGQIFDIVEDVATVVLTTTEDGPMSQIPLRALAPVYHGGDHVKHRWSDSRGIVMSIDENAKTLTYAEEGSHNSVSTIGFARL